MGNVQLLPGTLAGSGGTVAGIGVFSVTGTGNDFGTHCCNAVISSPTANDLNTWKAAGTAVIAHVSAHAAWTPPLTGGWSYPFPAGGACAGSPGVVNFDTLVLSPTLSSVLGITDPAAAASLDGPSGLAQTILKTIRDNGEILAPQFSSPPSGPLTGLGVLT